MKFKLLPTRETLEYEMKVDRYWYYANQFKELCRFIDDFNIKAFCTDNLSLMKSGTFCRILQRGNVPNYAYDYNSTLQRAFHADVDLSDHNTWWKTASNKILFSAVPYASKEACVKAFNAIACKFNFPENIQIKFLDDKYCWRYQSKESIAPHLIIYSVD
ncbi:MAG: hypothetical protein IJM40_05800 [Synergistaceae bacterium]|nr:hypothetical protein [Synergistaceae bacterium]